MKAYKLEILVIDHDELGGSAIADVIENQKYPNWCIYPKVMSTKEADIGEWEDKHPLNLHATSEKEYLRLFNDAEPLFKRRIRQYPVRIDHLGNPNKKG